MANITPQFVQPVPLWDINTTESVTGAVAGKGNTTYTVPDHCYVVWISTDGAHSSGCHLATAAGDNTGVRFNGNGGDPRLPPISVTPGTVLHLFNDHATTAIIFTIIEFLNKPG